MPSRSENCVSTYLDVDDNEKQSCIFTIFLPVNDDHSIHFQPLIITQKIV